MSGYQHLAEASGRFRTRVGGAFPGSRAVFRGHDLHGELMEMEWLALYAYSITARRPSAAETRLMNALWVVTGYPDARIWCNRVAALAGTSRSTANLAICAGNAIAEASIYGRRNEFRAISYFLATRQKMAAGASLADCVAEHLAARRKLAGYGRPLANGDERIPPIMRVAESLGLHDGPHVRLAFALDQFLLGSGKPLRMNYGGLVAAFGADLGFSAQTFQQFMFPSLLAGMQPCYGEACELPAGSRFPTPCTGIRYEGEARRPWLPG
ncbi:citryl-CoA lyase [Chitinimonas arctica]|uniref:Citryl-CoA lyase n=1 Tax=Chitinimonas arctica TaxID=2594795 RepID=A0A516SAT3_9NEIS|nr:citryl-CoA lyase [Chitinimonas arctica]QDQ25255.1 citryl-CoA lyase [Chitinimonas arctica]